MGLGSWVNLEPVLLCYAVQFGIATSWIQPFIYWRQCIEVMEGSVADPATWCHDLAAHNRTDIEDLVQTDVGNLFTYIGIIAAVGNLLVAPSLSSWSDGPGGRKAPLLITLAGSIIAVVVVILCTAPLYYDYNLILVAVAIANLTGGTPIAVSSVFSSINDDSRRLEGEEESDAEAASRKISIRIGIASGLFILGVLLGNVIAAYFMAKALYDWPVLISQLFLDAGFLYVVLVGRETGQPLDHTEPEDDMGFLRSQLERVKEWAGTLCRRREGRKRLCLQLAVGLYFLELFASMYGGVLTQVMLLWSKREPRNWSDEEYSIYQMFWCGILGLGMIALPPLVAVSTRCIGRSAHGADLATAAVGTLATGVFFAALPLTRNLWAVYAVTLTMVLGAYSPGFRSLVTQLVGAGETARITALVGLVESAATMASVAFLYVYKATMDHYDGSAFFLSALLQGVVVGGLGVLWWLLRLEEAEKAALVVDELPPGLTQPHDEVHSIPDLS